MNESNSAGLERRTVLGTAAGALAVGAAGCTALEDDDDPENATLEDLEVDALRETVAEQSEAEGDAVTLGVGFADGHLPITSELYESAPDAEISDTEQYESQELSEIDLLEEPAEELPTIEADETTLYALELAPGESRTMGLVVRSDEAVTFGAVPPEGEPYELGDGLVLNCYCIDELWNVPAEGTWTRVIEVGLEDDVEEPEPAAMVYNVFEEDEEG